MDYIYPNVDLWLPENIAANTDREIREFIAQQIQEAVAEARQEEHDRIRIQHAEDLLAVEEKARSQGFEEGVEQAAKKVEELMEKHKSPLVGLFVERQIRALKERENSSTKEKSDD